MELSIFEVVGPVMVGPSSSHTAGAARLARVARLIAGRPFSHVSFGLHGSFAKTYKGHGTDKALIAGALGLTEDDERLANAQALAREAGLTYDFYTTELADMHENSVRITFLQNDKKICEVEGSSIGGAQIIIRRINGFETEFTAQSETLLISQYDKKGIVSEVTRILAAHDINIGIMRLSREAKGQLAFCVIETDSPISEALVQQLREVPNILSAQAIRPERQESQDV